MSRPPPQHPLSFPRLALLALVVVMPLVASESNVAAANSNPQDERNQAMLQAVFQTNRKHQHHTKEGDLNLHLRRKHRQQRHRQQQEQQLHNNGPLAEDDDAVEATLPKRGILKEAAMSKFVEQLEANGQNPRWIGHRRLRQQRGEEQQQLEGEDKTEQDTPGLSHQQQRMHQHHPKPKHEHEKGILEKHKDNLSSKSHSPPQEHSPSSWESEEPFAWVLVSNGLVLQLVTLLLMVLAVSQRHALSKQWGLVRRLWPRSASQPRPHAT